MNWVCFSMSLSLDERVLKFVKVKCIRKWEMLRRQGEEMDGQRFQLLVSLEELHIFLHALPYYCLNVSLATMDVLGIPRGLSLFFSLSKCTCVLVWLTLCYLSFQSRH